MKLFSVLAATLLQESEAVCNAGDTVFTVTCHEDLVVELAVNTDCLTAKFPNVELTELQINPTDAQGTVPNNQCLPCTDADPENNCNTSDNFLGYDFTADPVVASAVSSTTTSLWFKAGQCGTSMTVSADGATATFQTDIGKPAEKINGIVVEPTLLDTDITCSYPSTISGIPMDPGMTVIADASQDSDKVQQDANPDAVSQDLFTMTSRSGSSTGSVITSTDSITLGTTVFISVATTDQASGITNFYLGDCTASDGASKSLKIITDGCMENLDNAALLTQIAPQSSGQVLQFNQFAFADADEASLNLDFEVTCDIILGTAPTKAVCETRRDGIPEVSDGSGNIVQTAVAPDASLTGEAGRRRRRAAATKFTESTGYGVTAGEKIAEVTNGIVVAHSGSGKASDGDAESGAVSAAVAIMAGTAVMLL